MFGYVQGDIEVPEELKKNFANITPTFKKNKRRSTRYWIADEGLGLERRISMSTTENVDSTYFLENGTLINPLLLFYLDLGLVCKKNSFVENIPVECFNKNVQFAVNARREGDKNPNSSVVAESMKLLANSSYGYQIKDRSRHTVTNYLRDKETQPSTQICSSVRITSMINSMK